MLTDEVLGMAVAARAPVFVIPCCHDRKMETGGLEQWMPRDVAQDVCRVQRLQGESFEVSM